MDYKLIGGKTISLRLATMDDSIFIHSIRTDNKLSKHITKVTGTAETQRLWLSEYKKRELLKDEFYFIIIKNRTLEPIGTVRVYGITQDLKFCWGSWVLNENKTVTSAIESAYLIYKFAFDIMGFESAYFQVDNENSSVISFHKKSGATLVNCDKENHNFIYEKNSYEIFKKKYIKILEVI